jgi:hypothetical protein
VGVKTASRLLDPAAGEYAQVAVNGVAVVVATLVHAVETGVRVEPTTVSKVTVPAAYAVAVIVEG